MKFMTCDFCYVSFILATFQLVVISFFNKAKSFFGDLTFLQFRKKYDICNQHEVTSGCCIGKISVIGLRLEIFYFGEFKV